MPLSPSPLQLRRYFVSELSIQANKRFKTDQPVTLGMDDVVLEPRFTPIPKKAREWEVVLRIFHQGKEGVNTPYYFSVELVAFFGVHKSYEAGKSEWLVRTNASSVLYSMAREILRSAMSHGPFMPLILPTVTFYTEEADDALTQTKAGTPTPRRRAARTTKGKS